MRIRRWEDIGIKGRAALFMVIPVVLTISVFGYFVTLDRLDYSERNFIQRGELLVRNFSSIIELSMVAQDKAALQLYADVILKEEGVVSVLMADIDGKALIKKLDFKNNKLFSRIKYISAPVLLTGVTVGGFENESAELSNPSKRQPIGQLRIGILFKNTNNKQKEILIFGLISTLLGIIISSVFGYRVARVITRPILKLNNAVNSISAGDLAVRVDKTSTGEIGDLQQGINNMAAALHDAQTELQDKIKKATNDLNRTVSKLESQNIELAFSKSQAEKLGNEKTQFLARMSHELRTPLNAVIGFSRLMEKDINENDRQDYARTIINSATQLTSVIDDVLTFSKLKSDSLHLSKKTFSPKTLSEDVVLMMSAAAHDKKLELVLFVDNNVPAYCDGDAPRINQVLTNIITNAIKFTNQGEVVIIVKCQLISGKDNLVFYVNDTGCGFSEDNRSVLFKEFSQLHNDMTRTSDGVGLGLSISRRLVRKMGGDINVKSQINKGSSFSFNIPLLNPISEHNDNFGFNTQQENLLSAKNAILVEENISSCESIKTMLQRCGMQVFIATNTDEINSIITNQKIDTLSLIVLGVSADQLETTDCHAQVKKLREAYQGHVLLLSSCNTLQVPSNISEQEKLICLAKPIREKTLCQNISNALEMDIKPESTSANRATIKWLQNKKILIVEDNAFNQKLIRMMLEARGAEVEVVQSGRAAILAVNHQAYHLILMDLHMPEMDGASAAKTIREFCNTPIALVTADVLTDIQSLKDSGIIDEVLYKPIDDTTLDLVLTKCLEQAVPDNNISANAYVINKAENVALKNMDSALQNEILRLCTKVDACLQNTDNPKKITTARDYIHQLVGLAGYYKLEKLSQEVNALQEEIKLAQYRRCK